ncbi:very short patch repair endonuclease [Flavihumibacter fluvii]|uniref:very short patch repair endonuclease n=1 Tax=Flavihumibacter fluvii TaxID=2838157 RepID=UPI001BDEFCA1|nr:DNA mismatch endonuclease Vsr [Flavihumibacter fluvii]
MTDVHTKDQRSYNMSRIRGSNTKPEVIVRKFLFSEGYRFRLHSKKLPGRPDVVLPKYKTVIFVNGCFWHGHKHCKYFVIPKTRTEWWLAKINSNIANDQYVEKSLKILGWKIIKVWECQLKKEKQVETLKHILLSLKKF